MARKITRKQLLKEPDEILTFTQKTFAYILLHKTKFISVLGAVFAVLIIISGVRYYADNAEKKAFDEMNRAVKRYEALAEKDGQEKAYQTVRDDLQRVAEEYGSRKGGKMARLKLANLAYEAGDYDRAVEEYQDALKAFSDSPALKNLIVSSLGYAMEGRKEYEKAAGYFEQIASGASPVMKEDAVYHLAWLYGQMGEKAKSDEAYQRLLDEFKTAIYAELVKDRVPPRVKEAVGEKTDES